MSSIAGDDRTAARRRQPWSAWIFAAALIVVVALVWVTVGQDLRPVHAPRQIPWWLLAPVFLAAYIAVLRFEFSGEMQEVTLSEVPLLVGLVFAPPDHLLLATVLGGVVALLWARPPPIKALFNLGVTSLETVVAVICFHAVVGDGSAIALEGWLAALLAVAAANTASTVCVQAVIALSVGRFDRSSPRALVTALAGVAVVDTAAGMTMVTLIWYEPLAALPALGIVAVLGVFYRSHSALRRRHDDLQSIYQFSTVLAGLTDAEEVIAAVLAEARTRLRGATAELALEESEGTVCHVLRGDGPPQRTSRATAHPLSAALAGARRSVVARRNTNEPTLSQALASCGYRDAVAVPLPAVSHLAGTLIVADRLGDPVSFEAADLRPLQVLANHTAVALHATRLLDWLRQDAAIKDHLALHDPLTDLANRALFNDQVEAALAECDDASVVAVMLIDLDRFKQVNDTLGHHCGDIVLQQIASQLTRAVATRGSVGRLGGDEFAVVVALREVGELAEVVADVLDAGHASISADGFVLTVGASVGVALAPDHGRDRSTLLRAADDAMYQAKAARVGVAFSEPGCDGRTALPTIAGRANAELRTDGR